MKDYGTFFIACALSIAGCASADSNPATGTSGVNTGVAGTQPSAAGMPGSSTTGAAGAATSAASAGGAAKPPTSATATAGSSAGTATGSVTAGSAAGAAGSKAAAAGSGGSASTPPAAGSWMAAYLAIFDASVSQCSQCHVVGGVLGPPDFTTPDKAYDSIVDKETSMAQQAQCKGMGKYVVPGNCEESILYNKLSQDTPKCGRRMPPSSDAMPMRVPQDKLDILCAWIKAGAKKD